MIAIIELFIVINIVYAQSTTPLHCLKMATSGTHLLGGRLNLTLVREAARAELSEILGDSSVKKVRPVQIISGATELRTS